MGVDVSSGPVGRSEGRKEERLEALRWTASLERLDRFGVTTDAVESASPSSFSFWSAEGPKDLRRFVDLRGLLGRFMADSVGYLEISLGLGLTRGKCQRSTWKKIDCEELTCGLRACVCAAAHGLFVLVAADLARYPALGH